MKWNYISICDIISSVWKTFINAEPRHRAVFFRTYFENEAIYGEEGVTKMNKHRGSNFDDYLKERGISEEVSELAQEQWEILRAETTSETESSTEVPDSSPSYIKRFLSRLGHIFNHLFS